MKKFVILMILVSAFSSCKKEEKPSKGNISVNISYKVDDKDFIQDTFLYENEARYEYKVSRLEYFLSGFKFKKDDGEQISSSKIFYLNAINNSSDKIKFSEIEAGNFSEISFYIGLDSLQNISRSLDNNIDRANMFWPDAMGGGYHFMKFEGTYFKENISDGFAMHIGKNKNLIKVTLKKNFTVKEGNLNLNLEMNLNEWFRNPEIYDFVEDGGYSMSDDDAMDKLKKNGSTVFKIK